MNNKWNDAVIKGANDVKNFLDFVLKERSQLYGSIIFLMISNNLKEIELPSSDTFRRYGDDYYIVYEKAEDAEDLYRIRLVEMEENSET